MSSLIDKKSNKYGQSKEEHVIDTLILYTDGGARPTNPGPSGVGMVLIDNSDNILWESFKPIGIATNNYAEYKAVLIGVKYVIETYGHDLLKLIIRSDSLLVVNCLNGLWNCKSKSLRGVYQECIKELDLLKYGWSCEWVRGHNGDKYNERADKLATKGCMR